MKDKHGKVIYEPYRIKVLNTINFKKSMHYNPFAYIHSEKDILKLVTTLIANTKGEGKAGDDFWVKAETLLYCALIGYIHYEAPIEEHMADKPTNRERLQEITAGIEQGIKELFESEKYMRYLSVMSKFHRYSVNNTMLIYMQRPDATLVAGFQKWKNQFERHVKKGEHGITIIAPTPYKKKIEEMKRDPDTQAPILDADGKAIMEEKEIEIPMFRPVKVFDVSQTDGKPLPELASSLSGTVPHYEAFMEALRRSAPVPIEFEAMAENMDGYFSPEQQRIAIRKGKLTDLEARRTKCRNRLRRCRDPTECEALHTEKDELTKQITETRKELKTAQQIPFRVKRMRENIQLLNDREQQRAAHREER